MVFLLGGARPLGSAWLWVHLLLWILETPLVSPQGELCGSWTSGMGDLDSSFQCPPDPDWEDLKFCCGTCENPYCCYSEGARLDQTLCSTPHQDEPTTDAPNIATTLAPYSEQRKWVYISAGIIIFLFFGIIICCFEKYIRNAFRRFRRWYRIQNRDHQDDPPPTIQDHQGDPSPTIQCPSGSVGPSPDGEHSAEDPQDSRGSSPSSNVPLVPESDHENAGYQNGQAQPYSSPTSEPGVAVGDGSSSHTSAPSTDPEEFYRSRPRVYALVRDPTSSNDSEDSRGTRRRRTASVGLTLPSSNETNVYRDYSLSCDSQVPTGGTRQTNPPAQPANLGYALPERFTRSSPALYLDQPPYYNKLFPLGTPVSLPTLAIAQLGRVEASIPEDGAQPRPTGPLDHSLAMGGQSPSQACALSLVPPPSEAEEPRGTGSQMSTQAERDSPRLTEYESLGTRPQAPHPQRRVFPKSSIDYEALGARPRTSDPGRRGPPRLDDAEGSRGTRPQSPASEECLPPSYDEASVTDRPPRHSTKAGPSFTPQDPPPYDVAVSSDIESVRHASDRQSMGQTQHATAGAKESPVSPRPVITVTAPDLPGATTAGPISEHVPTADELDLQS